MSRRVAREVAFKLIFEFLFSGEKKPESIEEYAAEFSADQKVEADDIAFISELYLGVTEHIDEIDSKIAGVIENFELSRLFKVDHALLAMAVYEIEHIPSVPYKVSVDEALNLAKKYSTEKSAKYINGVLSKFERKK